MRVLLDCRMATWTGVGRYTRGLARALGERDDVELIELVAPGEAATSSAATVRECPGHPFSLGGAQAFARAAREVAPDVLHCLHFPTPYPMRHPLVVTVHDFTPLAVAGVMPSGARRLAYRLMLRRAIRGADRIVTLSEYSAKATREFYEPARERVSVTPAAADDFAAGPVGALPPSVTGRYVLALGSTRPHKRLDVLLHAWASLESIVDPDVSLVIVGNEPDGYVTSVLGELPAPQRVVWTGRADDGTLRALYANAALFAFPSSHEGFGLPPLEAMALGAPVVCADATSVPEVVGDAALLVEPGDWGALAAAIERVLADDVLARDLAGRGRARAATFSWARTAERTVDVYADAMRSRR